MRGELNLRRGGQWAAGLLILGVFGMSMIGLPLRTFALGQKQYVTEQAGGFPIFSHQVAAGIYVETNDFPGVVRVVNDLQTDIRRVTGGKAEILKRTNDLRGNVIIVGTVGRSEIVDRLIEKKKIDVSEIAGKWESFVVQVVAKPMPGVEAALVICGSDQRGTIYGVYDLSEQMGVSPWYFWEDVPSKHHGELYVKAGKFIEGPPTVKYRGIFLNDEAPDLTGWVKARYGDYNHGFYTNVFELLLRLKANYLWPAMWNNCFNEDDPLNPELANEYGIVMGTSHVEPMMRADKEWNRAGYTQAQWNFEKSPRELTDFWRAGIERNRPYENIITMAMRGKIDTPMSESANIGLLERIVDCQRGLIADVYHTNAAAVPQLWALYKEVQEYYEKGMRVPDDVTLLWCDDNWGNLRKLPAASERRRSGGAGIYYHFDYVGGPRNYKWVNSCPIPRIWEQMNLAYEYGADRIWIVNVGHLQHVAFPTEFFLSLARDPKRWSRERFPEFTQLWAEREFGAEQATNIAELMNGYTELNGLRKPELLDADTFSLTNYDEAEGIQARWTELVKESFAVEKELPTEERDAFFELVGYPVRACANLMDLFVAVARNRLHDAQRRTDAKAYAAQAKEFFQEDATLADYYNHTLAQGKWEHMMDQTHIGYTGWQQPETNHMPEVVEAAEDDINAVAVVGVSFLNSERKAPKGFVGFVEGDGYVAMDAGHFTGRRAAHGVSWEAIEGLGMSIFPVTAASVQPPKGAPVLEYTLYLFHSGPVGVTCRVAPTLNFVAGRGLRMAVSFDEQAPQVLTVVPENYSVGAGDGNTDWEQAVKNNVRPVKATLDPGPAGEHTLKVWMVDPGVVLEKIVVDTGGVKPSYLGPPESFYRTAMH